ncbi:hypothetical protein HHI36_023410 [Cryptolaemus montrouzieri]|uniref:MADF domain-containing protein n=1 Tax=Cryptolaemus montrouzieri TaxID=559131 RepID=A0ABD2PGB0_9CUCU
MRTAWRREHMKVLNSKRSGTGTEDVYEPTLWYYELLQFIADQETPRPTKSNVEEEDIFQDSETEVSSGEELLIMENDPQSLASSLPGSKVSTDYNSHLSSVPSNRRSGSRKANLGNNVA